MLAAEAGQVKVLLMGDYPFAHLASNAMELGDRLHQSAFDQASRSQPGVRGNEAGRSMKRTLQRRDLPPVDHRWQRRGLWAATLSHDGEAWHCPSIATGGDGQAHRRRGDGTLQRHSSESRDDLSQQGLGHKPQRGENLKAWQIGGSGRSSDDGRDSKTRPEPRTRGRVRPREGVRPRDWREPLCPRLKAESPSGEKGREPQWRRALCQTAKAGRAQRESALFKPYWGKPAVRNFRGVDGIVATWSRPMRVYTKRGRRAIFLLDREIRTHGLKGRGCP